MFRKLRALRSTHGRTGIIIGIGVLTLIYLLPKLHVPRASHLPVYPFIRYAGMKAGDADDKAIPRIIHQTWKTNKIPILFEKWVRSWLEKNPGWEYWFWTDEDIQRLVSERFPHLLSLFNGYPTNGHRADAFRYMVLLDHGGLYADIDMECLKDLEPIVSAHDCLLSQEPEEHGHFLSPVGVPLVSNALMACRPRHPFFRLVVDGLESYAGWLTWTEILHSTGPYMLTEMYRGYHRKGLLLRTAADDHPVFLAAPVAFQPLLDMSMLDPIRQMCLHSKGHGFLSQDYYKTQKRLCDNLFNNMNHMSKAPEEAFTVHHFTHTWAGRRYDPWGVYNSRIDFNVEDVVQRNLRTPLARGEIKKSRGKH